MANQDSLWLVYLLRCRDGSLYCGVTKDLRARLALHRSGKGSKYVRSRLPVEVAFSTKKMTSSEAFGLERQVKKLSADKKLEFLQLVDKYR